MNTQNNLYNALEAKMKSQRATALATLSVYFNYPAGIGEHPQMVEEMEKLLKDVAEAQDCLQTLKDNFHEYEK
tara:strand:+ start:113 stop:331 length:219 start_codon:yes stop_codon:yes gene_type:complete